AASNLFVEFGGQTECRERRPLRGRRDAVGRVEKALLQARHPGLGRDGVAHAPARHRVGLRERVAGDGALEHSFERGDGDVLAFVDEVFVSLVCDDDEVALLREARDLFSLLAREDYARRVLRRVAVDSARPLRRVARERLREAFAPSLFRRDEDGRALAVRDEVFYRSPVGREDQNLFAWIDDRLERAEEPLHAAVEDYHVRLARAYAVALAQLRGDCGAKLR